MQGILGRDFFFSLICLVENKSFLPTTKINAHCKEIRTDLKTYKEERKKLDGNETNEIRLC